MTKKDPYYYIKLLENYAKPEYYEGRSDREKAMLGEQLESTLKITFCQQEHNFDFTMGCRVYGVIQGQGEPIIYQGTFLGAGMEGMWIRFDKPIYMPMSEEEKLVYLIEPLNCKDTIMLRGSLN